MILVPHGSMAKVWISTQHNNNIDFSSILRGIYFIGPNECGIININPLLFMREINYIVTSRYHSIEPRSALYYRAVYGSIE